jgi:hypothetical protein
MRALAIIPAALCLLALGCGKESESERQNTAKYVIEGRNVTCYYTCDTSEFSYGGYHTFTCVWCCADYKDQWDRYVSITFRDTGSTWVIESEYVSRGICDKAPGVFMPIGARY